MAGREAALSSDSQAARGRRALFGAVRLFRWAALAWMVALAATVPGGFERPEVAWAAIGAAGAWSAWATVPNQERRAAALWFELALAFGLIVVSGYVAPEGAVTERPFFATAWPAAAVAAWGVARGPVAGAAAALPLGAALMLSRIVNGVAVDSLEATQVQAIANGTVMFILAGSAVGLVSRLLERSALEQHALLEETMRALERTTRLEERERLGRAIHDSVLQSLAMVHKRGRELAADGDVPPGQVAELAEMAAKQEAELRALIVREPEDDSPSGSVLLREEIERVARETGKVPVTVSSTGPTRVRAQLGEEIVAAVRQALENLARHADATRATVFVDAANDILSITVKDDGKGFVYDEEELRAAGKLGLLQSMKGRIEGLGGQMFVASSDRGTEVEFRVPL